MNTRRIQIHQHQVVHSWSEHQQQWSRATYIIIHNTYNRHRTAVKENSKRWKVAESLPTFRAFSFWSNQTKPNQTEQNRTKPTNLPLLSANWHTYQKDKRWIIHVNCFRSFYISYDTPFPLQTSTSAYSIHNRNLYIHVWYNRSRIFN